jgi:hypothetical protein
MMAGRGQWAPKAPIFRDLPETKQTGEFHGCSQEEGPEEEEHEEVSDTRSRKGSQLLVSERFAALNKRPDASPAVLLLRLPFGDFAARAGKRNGRLSGLLWAINPEKPRHQSDPHAKYEVTAAGTRGGVGQGATSGA